MTNCIVGTNSAAHNDDGNNDEQEKTHHDADVDEVHSSLDVFLSHAQQPLRLVHHGPLCVLHSKDSRDDETHTANVGHDQHLLEVAPGARQQVRRYHSAKVWVRLGCIFVWTFHHILEHWFGSVNQAVPVWRFSMLYQ